MMKLQVNGDELNVADEMTVEGLVQQLGLNEGPVAVERNGAVVPRAEHGRASLNDGDVIEIVHFVGGG